MKPAGELQQQKPAELQQPHLQPSSPSPTSAPASLASPRSPLPSSESEGSYVMVARETAGTTSAIPCDSKPQPQQQQQVPDHTNLLSGSPAYKKHAWHTKGNDGSAMAVAQERPVRNGTGKDGSGAGGGGASSRNGGQSATSSGGGNGNGESSSSQEFVALGKRGIPNPS